VVVVVVLVVDAVVVVVVVAAAAALPCLALPCLGRSTAVSSARYTTQQSPTPQKEYAYSLTSDTKKTTCAAAAVHEATDVRALPHPPISLAHASQRAD